METELELLRNLAEAEDDVCAGRADSMENTFDDIPTALEARRNERNIKI